MEGELTCESKQKRKFMIKFDLFSNVISYFNILYKDYCLFQNHFC